MTRMKLRRNAPKSHRGRRALIAAGALGAAVGGVRRYRHRRHPEQVES